MYSLKTINKYLLNYFLIKINYHLLERDFFINSNQKGTKTALETGRTFSTLFADFGLRMRLLVARDEQEFKQLMWEHMKDLAEEQQCIGQVGFLNE